MKEFFLPLKVFVVGNIMLGALMWFWAAAKVDDSVAVLAANTTAWASLPTSWGWSWLMTSGVVRWLAFVIGFLTVCFVTGLVFWRQQTQF